MDNKQVTGQELDPGMGHGSIKSDGSISYRATVKNTNDLPKTA